MASALIDRRVSIVDDDGDLITVGNPFPVTISGTLTGVAVATAKHGEVDVGGVATAILWEDINSTAKTAVDIVAAVVGKKIRVLSSFFSSSGAAEVDWMSGATILIPRMGVVSSAFYFQKPGPQGWWIETAVGEALRINQIQVAAAVRIRGAINYVLI